MYRVTGLKGHAATVERRRLLCQMTSDMQGNNLHTFGLPVEGATLCHSKFLLLFRWYLHTISC